MATLTQQINSNDASTANLAKIDQKIEVTIFPVADVDRAKEFYLKLGWRLDADFNFPSFRVVQVTPHGSTCSLQFGTHLTSAAPGSGKGYIIVSDIVTARNALTAEGVQVGDFSTSAKTAPNLGWIRSAALIAPVPSLKIPMATAGCCKRSPADCRVVSSLAGLHLPRPAILPAR